MVNFSTGVLNPTPRPGKLGDDFRAPVWVRLNRHSGGKLRDEEQAAAMFGECRRQAWRQSKPGSAIGNVKKHAPSVAPQPNIYGSRCVTNNVPDQLREDHLGSQIV